MKVKMILPALTEAKSPYWRPIKYSLFPPLGLATLAGYLSEDDEVTIQDEHVETLHLDDEPDLVVIQVYITSAHRAYELADYYRRRGAHVVLGGLHVTSLPGEAARRADTIFLGPGEDTWPAFLADFRAGRPQKVYRSQIRTLIGLPHIRRDLIKRHLYLVPNSIVVSRGCPHTCDFCYKEAFFRGGKSFYTQAVDDALAEIERLPGRHLYFLDDHLFGNPRFASALFDGILYDTRHVVFRPAKMPAEVLEAGYWHAYREFYRWGSIFRSAWAKDAWFERLRHMIYAGGWKKMEFVWHGIIRLKRVSAMLPVLEAILEGFRRLSERDARQRTGLSGTHV